MCGIVAVFARRYPVSPATLHSATKSLYHRGPDGQGQWLSSDSRVRLGHARLSLWAKTGLPAYVLTMLGDRMEMAHSVEGRVPFLDHHLVEVICSQPVNQKIRGMTEKYVLLEAARDVITDNVYRRQKHPFLSPPATLAPEERLNTSCRTLCAVR